MVVWQGDKTKLLIELSSTVIRHINGYGMNGHSLDAWEIRFRPSVSRKEPRPFP